MAFRRDYSSRCLFLVAIMAAMWQSGQGKGQEQERELLSLNDLTVNVGLDICGSADYPALCRSVVKGLRVPSVAIESAIRQLMFQTDMAKSVAQKRKNSDSAMDVCFENYDDAFSNLETCLANLKSRDKGSLNINLSAALTDYATCDDAIAEGGPSSSVTRTNLMLRQMASNCLYLSSLIHFH